MFLKKPDQDSHVNTIPFNISTRRAFFIISVLAFTAYAPTLKVGFLWDDHVIIENNTYIKSWTWQNIKHDFQSDNTQGQGDNYYRPFQSLSHRLDYSLWKLNPFGYHLDNLMIHIANGFLIYLLVIALGIPSMIALMTASLFVVNPIGVELFIIPSGRTTALSFCLSLICILLLLRDELPSLLLGYVTFFVALLTKEFSMITPMLLTSVLYLRRDPLRKWWILLPMFPLMSVYLFMREHAVHSMIGPLDISLFVLFMTKVFTRIVWHYIFLILCPWNLHSHRLIPHLIHLWWMHGIALAGIISWAIWKRHRIGLFCLSWLLIGLLPAIPVMIRGSFMLDHWGYPIALGVILPIAWGCYKGWISRSVGMRTFSFGIYFMLIIIWSLLTHLNVALRGTDEKLYRWALHFTTSHPIKYNLGVLLASTDRPQEAIIYFEDVREDYPDDADNINALAFAYLKAGNPWMARHVLEMFVQSHPDDALTQRHLKLIKLPPKRR